MIAQYTTVRPGYIRQNFNLNLNYFRVYVSESKELKHLRNSIRDAYITPLTTDISIDLWGKTKFNKDIVYDVVTLYDVLQKVKCLDVKDFLRDIKTKIIIISVPWNHFQPNDPRFLEWEHCKPNDNFHYFTPSGITDILVDLGYKILSVSNVEDSVAPAPSSSNYPNMITVIAEKI